MIVVTGATGNIGSLIVRRLHQQGVPVRAFVRNPERARAILGDDVPLTIGDFADAASLRTAMHGADTVLLSSGNHPLQAEYETAVIEAAARADVRRIVKLSTVCAAEGSSAAFWDHHGRAERALWSSGIPAVCIQSNFYMSNLLAAAPNVREHGALFAPLAGARIAMIDPRDVADFAVHVLTTTGHDGRAYGITGPAAITYEDAAQAISTIAGRDVSFVPVPDEAAYEAMRGNGLPEWMARQVVTMFGLLRQDAAAAVTTTFADVTGARPRSIADFLHDHASLFRATPLETDA